MKKTQKSLFIIPVLLVVSHFMIAQTTSDSELINIKLQKSSHKMELQISQVEVSIECSGPISYESFTLPDPSRLVIDISGIAKISAPQSMDINDLGITKITTGAHEGNMARVVLHFVNQIPEYKISEEQNALKIIVWKSGPLSPVRTEKVQVAPPTQPPPPPKKSVIQAPPQVEAADPNRVSDVTISLGSGLSFLQEAAFQEVYGKSVMFIRGELSFNLPISFNNLDLWTSVTVFNKAGAMTLFEEETSLNFTTFSLALRYLRKMNMFVPFFGAGVDYISYKEIYPEGFIVPSVGGNDLGFHLQAGCYFKFLKALSAKLHLKYNFAKTMENDFEINLGGIEYGLSLAYHFNL